MIHLINDLSNKHVVNLLKSNFCSISNKNIVKNYHPDYSNIPGNLFYILAKGRYKQGMYYVVEKNGKYICSAGWNKYHECVDTALLLTRAYVSEHYRSKYPLATYLLPLMIDATSHYKHVWITCNEHNRSIYSAFERLNSGKSAGLFNQWPDVYKKFKPIGLKTIYNTQQYVVERENNMTRIETLEFLIKSINKINPNAKIINEDSVLSDLGLNSLDIVELQMFYEETTSTDVPDSDRPLITVKDLLNLLNK